MFRSNTARLFAENFDARLAGIVIWPDCPLFEEKKKGPSNPWTSTKLTIYVFKNPGAYFFEGAEAPQAAATQPQRAWGALKSLKNYKIHKIHTPKLQGRVFSEGAEAPQAAATQTQRAGGPWNRQQIPISKMSNLIIWKTHSEIGIGTVSTCPTIQISKKNWTYLTACIYLTTALP